MRNTLSTSEFAEAVGISESSARRIADSGELQVHRTGGGHRKIPVAEAIRYARENKKEVLRPDLLGLEESSEATLLDGESDAPTTESGQLLNALQTGNYPLCLRLLQTFYLNGGTMDELCDGPIQFAMNAIGNAWPHNNQSIFVEHRASMMCVRALCELRALLQDVNEDLPMAIGGAPQDDPYLLPSLMASLVVHENRWNNINLGPNTPLDVLADAVEDFQPSLVWLAITDPIRSRQHHRELEKLSNTIDSCGGKFVIGGRNSGMYSGPGAIRCSSMRELRILLQELGQ